MTSEMVRMIRLFEAGGINPLILKGPPLALKLYGDIALRPSKDIDIMVQPEALERAEIILQKEGYHKNTPDFPMTPRQKKAQLENSLHFKYIHSQRDLCLELHWKIHPIDLKFQALANFSTGKVEMAGCLVPVLADEELFLYLMVHGSRHMWFRLRWLCDIERFMEQEHGIDWDKIIFLANHSGQRAILHQTMILVKELFEVPVPHCLREHAANDKKAGKLAATVAKFKIFINVTLMVLLGMLEGIGIFMLIPFLSIAGIIPAAQSAGGTDFGVQHFFNRMGTSISLPVVLIIYTGIIFAQSWLQRYQSNINIRIQQSFHSFLSIRMFKALAYAKWSFLMTRKKSDITHMLTSELARGNPIFFTDDGNSHIGADPNSIILPNSAEPLKITLFSLIKFKAEPKCYIR